MRIAEVSSPPVDLSPEPQNLVSDIESLIRNLESITNDHTTSSLETLTTSLRKRLTQLSQLAPLATSLSLHLWKLSYRLWNSLVDLSNTSPQLIPLLVHLRHLAADILSLAGSVVGVPSPEIKIASFYLKTALIYLELKQLSPANTCFESASNLVSNLDLSKLSDDATSKKLLLDLNLARSRAAWESSDKILAEGLLTRARSHYLFGSFEHYKALSNQYLAFGKSILSTNKNDSSSNNTNFKEALRLMNEALDLSDRGLSITRTREETLELKEIKSSTLRFIAAVHLQGEEFESVLKCVKCLREGGDQHPSLGVLAVKGWIGLGRYEEAEKELRGMVVNRGIPEGIWLSALEAYFKASGSAGAETLKGVFLGLLGRCQVSAGSAIRVVSKLIGGSGAADLEGGGLRAKVVVELVSDERVVALFEGGKASKEKNALHALLWNCAADNFRSKDHVTSAEMFEKSLLYVPDDVESRILRAKGFRALCLCHLGLSQLDRALEYINEAEKLEPNVACAFLKFKIFLQKKNHSDAMSQLQSMMTCLDFTPDFLTLAAHEATASKALPVTVASLSSLLDFYSLGKPMPTPEVVVLRTIISILNQEPGNEPEVLRFMKRTHTRAFELGAECFFGKGEAGRREQNWFAVMSWNLGWSTGKGNNFQLSAEFYRFASEFYAVQVDGLAEENNKMVCKSLILTVSSLLASELINKASLLENDVLQAAELLDKAEKMLMSISTGPSLSDHQNTPIEPNFLFFYTFGGFHIHGRLNDPGRQQLLVKKFAASKACSADYLLQIGLTASEGRQSNYKVANFAFNECLSALLSSTSPDYQKVALSLRKLISVASIHKGEIDDDAVYKIYTQAYRIMVGLKEGEYPTDEGKWLATTAWNRGALPVRLGQVDVAKKWMQIGLDIAKKVGGMETYRSCMEDTISGLEKKLAGCSREVFKTQGPGIISI